ncbi:MAG: hypothetical protein ACLR7Z_13110 [Bilophila wadsworthia]
MLEGDGTIRTLNNKAQAMLDLPPDATAIFRHHLSSDIIRRSPKAPIQRSGSFSPRAVRSTSCFRSPA